MPAKLVKTSQSQSFREVTRECVSYHVTHKIPVSASSSGQSGQRQIPFAAMRTVLDGEDGKRTNEIGVFKQMVDRIPDITGKTITVDALLTQRSLAQYLLGRGTHYPYTVKDNHRTLRSKIKLWFDRDPDRPPDCVTRSDKADHGRLEKREIWTTTELNAYLDFPGLQQAFLIKRTRWKTKGGKTIGDPTVERVYGITSHRPDSASAGKLPGLNRGHWRVENSLHHILGNAANWNEDKCRIRTGHGPEIMTLLRRFAIFLINKHSGETRTSVGEVIRTLQRRSRMVLDYLALTPNARGHPAANPET